MHKDRTDFSAIEKLLAMECTHFEHNHSHPPERQKHGPDFSAEPLSYRRNKYILKK